MFCKLKLQSIQMQCNGMHWRDHVVEVEFELRKVLSSDKRMRRRRDKLERVTCLHLDWEIVVKNEEIDGKRMKEK